ncbi:MAG: hypothetical protein HUK40_05625 [Desulfobacter sp.]|nr:hypothetical protein [Desulfobacter sp.]WDP87511.1 MAG: hypothetical protein HUN05_22240 [Desulfobacter sp.]
MDTKTKQSKAKAWAVLVLTLGALWVFAAVIGPYGEKHIPTFNTIVDTIEARDIDSGAYFYTEIDAGYDGPRELLGSIALKAPERYGFTMPFISGMMLCFLILIVGFKTLPME